MTFYLVVRKSPRDPELRELSREFTVRRLLHLGDTVFRRHRQVLAGLCDVGDELLQLGVDH